MNLDGFSNEPSPPASVDHVAVGIALSTHDGRDALQWAVSVEERREGTLIE